MTDAPTNQPTESLQTETRPTEHVSVMPREVVQWVCEHQPQTIVDGTYGGGGHTRLLLDQLSSDEKLLIIGMDRDPVVIARDDHADGPGAQPSLELFLGSYEKAPVALEHCNRPSADAFLIDLGLSSDQLADRNRGFSFTIEDADLDLRFDPESGLAAHQWLARTEEKDIADAIYQFGEERYSRRIAKQIVMRARERKPVHTVGDLVEICRRCVPRSKNHDIHPATRTFQALRIAVNDELGILQRTLASAADWISPGGRIVAISFHSLEDRIVKNAFRDDDRWEVLTRKPLRPQDDEVHQNPRSRSAKLRVAQRI